MPFLPPNQQRLSTVNKPQHWLGIHYRSFSYLALTRWNRLLL